MDPQYMDQLLVALVILTTAGLIVAIGLWLAYKKDR